MWGEVGAVTFAAFCLSKWAWEADQINFTSQTVGNGFWQASFGRGSFRLAPPSCYRVLLPCLLFPERSEAPYAVPELSPWRWVLYQTWRFVFVWLALVTLLAASGLTVALVAAALYGLTIRYDYWSNSVEFLAASLIFAHPHAWLPLLGAGLVLGAGRETLPLLACVGSGGGIAFGAGSGIAQVLLRRFVRTEKHWEGSLEYAVPMWRQNWRVLRGRYGPGALWYAGIYVLLAALAAPAAPVLAVVLTVLTFLLARIDEPRVLTMLVPFAAVTLCR